MDCISFIGTGNYEKAAYHFNGKECTTRIFSNACIEFFEPERLYLVMTEEAEAKHFASVNMSNCDVIPIRIPKGISEEEIWEIFNIIQNNIEENTELVIDITHSFRSLPLLSMAAAQYLTVVKKVKIKKIVYGAFEAKDADNNTPVFDLTSFLDIIKWTSSINELTKYGNAKGMHEILRDIQRNAYISPAERLPLSLGHFGNSIGGLTNALSLSRPKEAVEYSKKISKSLSDFEKELEHFPKAAPAVNVLNLFRERYNALISCPEDIDLFSEEGFTLQAKMMEFYIDTEKYVQAITLAREAFVSYILKQFPSLCPMKSDDRTSIEKIISTVSHDESYNKMEIYQIWKELTNIRNDINHAGMRENATNSQRAVDKIKAWVPRTSNYIQNKISREDFELLQDLLSNL